MSYCLIRKEIVTARKPHNCIWCGQLIHRTETYVREASVYDNRWQNHKWHHECDKDAIKHFSECGEEEFDSYNNERPKS